MRRSSAGALLALFFAFLAQPRADVVIHEFMAANNGSLVDDFGDRSDWIELHNNGLTPVDLLNWSLTDDVGNPIKWTFPSRIIEPGAYLLVFASNRNRKLPNAPLHTNFALSADGEYLALLRPDGTIATEFAPAFPRQLPDVSYGFPQNAIVFLVKEGAACQVGVPTSLLDFQDHYSGWSTQLVNLTGPSWNLMHTGVGYDIAAEGLPYGAWIAPDGNLQSRMHNINQSAFVRIPFIVDNPANILSLRLRMRWDDGFIAFLNGAQIASNHAPPNPTWNSGAEDNRVEALNEDWTDFPMPLSNVNLLAGTNILAFHGLNQGIASSDFLILPLLEGIQSSLNTAPNYLVVPTPGGPNESGGPIGPALSEATDSIPRPLGHASSPSQIVTVRVQRTTSNVVPDSVRLAYRTMYDAETAVTLRDDGLAPDATANDGVYSGTLPTTGPAPGKMLRWRFEAADSDGTVGRAPPYYHAADYDQYYGSVAENIEELTSQLPIFHQFIQNVSAADTLAGTRASVFYLHRFYDNVRIDLHGQSSLGFPKKSYNLDFNSDNRFTWNDLAPRKVKDVDLLSNHADKTRVRNTVAHEVARRAASPYHFAFPVRVQRNGSFHGVMDMMEDGDDRMLERNGLDPEGALYKVYNDLNNTNRAIKKTRKGEDHGDLQQLIDSLNPALPLSSRHIVAYDHLNIPAIINYLVTRQINSDVDHGHKNYYVYRDSNRTREWRLIIWDVDLSWGHNWTEPMGYFDDNLYFNNQLNSHAGDNPIYYLIYAFPEFRAMFLRRTRTLMDTILQPPGTSNGILDSFIRDLVATIDPDPAEPSPWTDGDLDFNKWGSWGRALSPRPEVEYLLAHYLAPRRDFLFNTHPATRPRLLPFSGNPIPDSPQSAFPGIVTFDSLDVLPVSGNPSEQYIVLRNNSPEAVDVSGWTLSGPISHAFEGGTVIPTGNGTPAVHYQGLLYVANDAFSFRSRAAEPTGGQRRFVQGNFLGHLPARGATLQLHDDTGTLIHSLTYPGTPTPWQQDLRIAELHYHPANPSAPELSVFSSLTDGDFEFIELVNIGAAALNLDRVTFTRGITFTFPPTELPPNSRAVLAKNPAAFTLRYPDVTVPVLGPYDGQLDNSGERVALLDSLGETILDFIYSDSWYPATDGPGRSLVLRDPHHTHHGDYSRAVSWAISLPPNGSPGLPDLDFAQAYFGWDNFHFSQPELDDPTISAPHANPDNDAQSNWQEYAFASNPRIPDQPQIEFAWIQHGSEQRPALRIRRPAHALDLDFALLASNDLHAPLQSWEIVSNTPHSVTPLLPGTELVTFLDNQPATHSRRFLRIRATFTP
jgi:hypothetical protein